MNMITWDLKWSSLCVSLTSLCVLLLPSQRGSRLHKIVKETVSRELSLVIQSDARRAEDHSLLAASPTLLSLLGSVKHTRSLLQTKRHQLKARITPCRGHFPKDPRRRLNIMSLW